MQALRSGAHGAGPACPSASRFADPKLDLARAIAWKDNIVGRLTNGVAGLLKAARVKTVHGWARFRDGKTVEVETETGSQIIRAETVVIATGSVPVELRLVGRSSRPRKRACAARGAVKELAVVGGGYIGLELGIAMHSPRWVRRSRSSRRCRACCRLAMRARRARSSNG